MQRDLEAIVGNRNRRVHEMTLAVGTLVLGVVFTLVDDIYSRSQLFAAMRIFPSNMWGIWFAILGSTRLMTLVINGFWPLSHHVRWGFSGVSALFVWVPIVASYMTAALSGFVTSGVSVGPIALIGELTCFYSLSTLRAGRRAHGQ